MFDIGPENRIETIHASDVALALARAVGTPEVWGRVFFLGGGPSCQLRYRDYVGRMLAAMGVPPLPDSAFATGAVYPTDWLDTADSEALLHYQRHTFDDITGAVARAAGWKRDAAALFGPLVRLALLRTSPYYRAHANR
jgi:nucleoside-diphosphate-sugar epimerase